MHELVEITLRRLPVSIFMINDFLPACQTDGWDKNTYRVFGKMWIAQNAYLKLHTKLSVLNDRRTVSGQALFGNTVLVSPSNCTQYGRIYHWFNGR